MELEKDFASIREKLLNKGTEPASSGEMIMSAQQPTLASMFQNNPRTKKDKPGFGVGVTFEDHIFVVCVSWAAEGKVAYFQLTEVQSLWDQVERRLADGSLDFRKSKW